MTEVANGLFSWRGDDYSFDLLQEGGSGGPLNLAILDKTIFRRGPETSDNVLLPYLATRMNLAAHDSGRNLLTLLRGAPETDFRSDIYKNGSLFLRGRVTFDAPNPRLYDDSPVLNLTCYSGVKRLINRPWTFTGSTMTWGEAIAYILSPLNFSLDIKIGYDFTHEGQVAAHSAEHQRIPMGELLSEQDEPDATYWDALQEILTLMNAQIWQEDGVWRVLQRSVRGASYQEATYNLGGVLQGTVAVDPVRTFNPADTTRESTQRFHQPTTRYITSRLVRQERRTRNDNLYSIGGNWDGWTSSGAETVTSNHFEETATELDLDDYLHSTARVHLLAGERMQVKIVGAALTQANGTTNDEVSVAEIHLVGSGVDYYLTQDGSWNSSFTEMDVGPLRADGSGEAPFEVALESDPAPVQGDVVLRLLGESTGHPQVTGNLFVSAFAAAPFGGQPAAKRIVLDLERAGQERKESFNIGDEFTGVTRGAVEYEDDITGWQKSSDWQVAGGIQSFHQVRISDLAAQLSERIDGVLFFIPPSKDFKFSETIDYDGKTYIPLSEERRPGGALEVLAFDLYNISPDLPQEYLNMAHFEGFGLRVPINVPWPIEQILEGPDGVDFRVSIGEFDGPMELALRYELYDASDTLVTAAQNGVTDLTSGSEGDFTITKDTGGATRAKIWLENEQMGLRVTEYKFRSIGRAFPTLSLSGSGDGTSNHELTATLGRPESGWTIEIEDVGGVNSTSPDPLLQLTDSETTVYSRSFSHPGPSGQVTNYIAFLRFGGITRTSNQVNLTG